MTKTMTQHDQNHDIFGRQIGRLHVACSIMSVKTRSAQHDDPRTHDIYTFAKIALCFLLL